MNFVQAISSCFTKYIEFGGRAPRSEYWYWVLFVFIVSICLNVLDTAIFPVDQWNPLSTVWSLATLLPGLAVAARRLHDVNRTGWWLLLWFVPIIGWIVLLVWAVRKGEAGDNRFGPDPLAHLAVEAPTGA